MKFVTKRSHCTVRAHTRNKSRLQKEKWKKTRALETFYQSINKVIDWTGIFSSKKRNKTTTKWRGNKKMILNFDLVHRQKNESLSENGLILLSVCCVYVFFRCRSSRHRNFEKHLFLNLIIVCGCAHTHTYECRIGFEWCASTNYNIFTRSVQTCGCTKANHIFHSKI